MCDRLAIKCAISILVPKLRGSNKKVPSVFLSPVGEEATASCLRMRTERLSLEKVNKENQADSLGLQERGKQTSVMYL